MLKLGLTGSIATGKSTTLNAFADLGVPVFSADDAVHALYAHGGGAVPVVEKLFPGTTGPQGVDRGRLSAALLAAPARLAELEAAVHPLVRDRLRQFLAEAETAGAELAVVDIPLLFETGFDYGLDAVIVTACRPETQRRRALARPGMSVGKLEAILARQLPQEEKKRRADYIIDTDAPIATVLETVAALVAKLKTELHDS
jgi:dephospho-CoA kinase